MKCYDFFFSKSKKTALHIAVQNNLYEYVELLLSDPRTDANILSGLFFSHDIRIKKKLIKVFLQN